MSEPQRPKSTGDKAPADTDRRSGDDIETQIEDGVEELAATFGAGPKAAPKPEGPMEGQQLAP